MSCTLAQEKIAQAKAAGHTELDLAGLELAELPPELWELEQLEVLNLSNNKLNRLPATIGQIYKLKRLDLSRNRLRGLSPKIGQLTNLQDLNLNENKLRSLTTKIGQLTQLQNFNLSSNQLISLCPNIGHLVHLIQLNVSSNQLNSLPPEIGQLTRLIELDFWQNELRNLPSEIGQLVQLKELVLSRNKLKNIPPEIGQLEKLITLDLAENPLQGLPNSLRNLQNLEKLDLRGCGLSIPEGVIGSDWDHLGNPQQILEYYFSLQTAEQRQPLNECKVLLVGQGKVGKTSIVNRLLDKTFNSHELKTDGIEIRQWRLTVTDPSGQDQAVRLNVWDFGGQEIMHATHQFFLTEHSLYLLVLDARLDEGENRLEYWLKIIESFGADSPVSVVGNQVDEHPLDLDRKGLQAKYPQIRAFVETSCKANQGFENLTAIIRREITAMSEVFEPLPLEWFLVKDRLEKMEENYIEYHRYNELCTAESVTKPISQETLLTRLHCLGIVLAFQDHDLLRNTHVLNPVLDDN